MTNHPEFRLLGTVTVEVDGTPVNIGHARQQTVLTALLINANTAISTDELIDRIWATHPPHRPKDTLHTYLTRLRKTLPTTTITRHGNSYQLTTPDTTIDLHHFRHLIRQARNSPDEVASTLFERALALWRGEPFTGLDTPWLATVRAALQAERLAARLDHNDVLLRLGQHAELLVSLATQTEEQPLDERLAGQYLLALYRSGRQADALHHYQLTRRRLGEELGVDPAAGLQDLHTRMLTNDPAIQAPAPRPAPRFIPRQLPARPRSFIGRTAELAELSAILDDTARPGDTVVISALSGSGGIGKTWLALQWAHQNLHRFPDGQLFVNLRGFDPSGRPTSQDTAVRAFLSALGVGASMIPLTTSAALTLYRELVRERTMLVLLDNAADTEQVEPLLPESPGCTVLITSRDRLDDLDTKQVYLDALPDSAARAVLSARLGEARLAAEPEATADLLACCAGLPLALSIVAGRALENPEFPLAVLAGELRDETTRLTVLDEDPTTGLRAVLSWSRAALRPDEATAFELLGLAPGPDISLPAAADLLGTDEQRTTEILAALERVALVGQQVPGRFRMHDLVRLYATEQAGKHLPAEVADAALRRLLDFYRHTCAIGNLALDPYWDTVDMDEPGPHCHPVRLADTATALAWFIAEDQNIQAAQRLAVGRGWHRDVWHLTWHTMVFRRQRGLVWERLQAAEDGFAAALALDDARTTHLALRCLGSAESHVGREEQALDHLNQALRIATETGDVVGRAYCLHTLQMAITRPADSQLALDYTEESLRLFRILERPVWVARALNSVGYQAMLLGHYEQALAPCTEALDIARKHHDRENEAATLDSLGAIAAGLGDHHTAIRRYQESLAVTEELGANYRVADILDHLGSAYLALGQAESAREQWREAARLYRSHYRYSMAEQVEGQLATLDKQSPQTLATLHNPSAE